MLLPTVSTAASFAAVKLIVLESAALASPVPCSVIVTFLGVMSGLSLVFT